MTDFLIYIAEVSVLMSVFYLFYRYLYFKLVYFEWSRYFFLGALFLSLSIPLLPEIFDMGIIFHPYEISDGTKVDLESNYYICIDKKIKEENYFDSTPFAYIFFIVWFVGFVFKLLTFTKKIVSIILLIKKSKKQLAGKTQVIVCDTDNQAFSFFNYIFVNNDFFNLSENEKNQILIHEKLHSRQLHSLDNLLFEIYEAVFWFNPVSRKISDSIKEIHEFIVDIRLTKNKNKPDYSRLILKLVSKKSYFSTVSGFSKDEIVNRIKLISNPESNKVRKRRFWLSLPVLSTVIFAFLLIITSVNAEAGLFDNEKAQFTRPLNKGTYIVSTPFFVNKKVYDKIKNTNVMYVISHPEITYRVKSRSAVLAIADGKVAKIEIVNDYGLKTYRLTLILKNGYSAVYKNLYKVFVKKNDTLKVEDKIAETGFAELYPTISLILLKNGKPVNPKYCY